MLEYWAALVGMNSVSGETLTKTQRREQELLELLRNYRRLELKQVADWLKISETTARRMCSRLEQSQDVIRLHGAVQLSEQYQNEYSYHNKEMDFIHEKVAIGKYCAAQIQSGDRIFCDSGTTIHQFVLSLVNRIKNKEIQDVVVLTNSLANFEPIANYCKVILLGGEVRLHRMDVCGSISEDVLRKFHVTKALLGVDAINSKKGFMTTDEKTAQMDEIVLADAETSYVLSDSSKFDKASFISYAKAHTITQVVTDWSISEEMRLRYEHMGFNIRVLGESSYLPADRSSSPG